MKSDKEKEAGACLLKKYGDFFKKQCQDFTVINKDNDWESNKNMMPVQVVMAPTELIAIADMVSSDNILITKVLGVLSSLCVEVITLKTEAFDRHFPFLSVYDEYNDSNIESQIEPICLLSAFVTRCYETLRNLCSQVFAIYTEAIINLNGIHLHYIINHIGEMFTILVLMELLISNTSLIRRWNAYYKKLKTLSTTTEKIEINEEKISAIIGAVDNINSKIMSDDIVQNTLSNVMTLRKNFVDKNCSIATSEFNVYLKQAIVNLEKLVQDKPNVQNMYKCIKINALFVLITHLFGTNDKKMFKPLLELNAKAHSIYICGTTLWYPEQFLQRYIPSLCGSQGKLAQTMLKTRQAYLSAKKSSITRDITTLQLLCTQWVLNLEVTFSNNRNELSAADMSVHAKIFLEGLDIATQANCYILTLLNLHMSIGVALSKSMLMTLFEVIDVLKCLKNAVTRNHYQIIKSINMIIQHLTFQATSSLLQIKKTLMTDKSYASKRLDELTCIVIAEKALKGSATLDRNVATNVALSFVLESTYLDDSYSRLGNLLETILTMANFSKTIENSCNCSWMLWHKNIIPIYFEQDFHMHLNPLRLKYFMTVLEDCYLLLHKTDKMFKSRKSEDFLTNLHNILDEKVLRATSQNIETNLRLHTHSHLQLDVINPFVNDMTKKHLLAIDHFRIQCIYMAVVPTTEHYLSTMYYNLTTVVLSDWKTYGEMRQMAKFKFNLMTVQDNLPTQTLEQGLDVLEIMRNIHIFVSKYLYNLNNQIFVEKSSNNKHLNSINIRHIANSIRTHGTGVMNTTVNFTYQLLKKKFYTFSQFMYDEHIKSRLVKDLRNFKEISQTNGNIYPYKSAEKFNKAIRQLGLVDDGQTYLDLFRDLISQIGNAMGYVRMIRSGGRHCCSDATVFLPSLEIKESFKNLCNGQKSIMCSEKLDQNISELVSNFIEGTEYFKLLVDVFAPVFRNPKNVHLKNFFIIVPPLTLNFVEHMILSKDKMSKKNKIGAAFTDDGFSMGVAYVLKLLNQDADFETLHWFDSIWCYIEQERRSLEEQKNQGSAQLQAALALTDKKIKIFEEEFKLLYYSLTSARIFFR